MEIGETHALNPVLKLVAVKLLFKACYDLNVVSPQNSGVEILAPGVMREGRGLWGAESVVRTEPS